MAQCCSGATAQARIDDDKHAAHFAQQPRSSPSPSGQGSRNERYLTSEAARATTHVANSQTDIA